MCETTVLKHVDAVLEFYEGYYRVELLIIITELGSGLIYTRRV